MKCEKCGKEIVTRGNAALCKDCRFKEKYSAVDFGEHKHFLKMIKAILQENKISYEEFAEILGYSAGYVKEFMVCRRYSQQLKEDIEVAIEKLKNKRPH